MTGCFPTIRSRPNTAPNTNKKMKRNATMNDNDFAAYTNNTTTNTTIDSGNSNIAVDMTAATTTGVNNNIISPNSYHHNNDLEDDDDNNNNNKINNNNYVYHYHAVDPIYIKTLPAAATTTTTNITHITNNNNNNNNNSNNNNNNIKNSYYHSSRSRDRFSRANHRPNYSMFSNSYNGENRSNAIAITNPATTPNRIPQYYHPHPYPYPPQSQRQSQQPPQSQQQHRYRDSNIGLRNHTRNLSCQIPPASFSPSISASLPPPTGVPAFVQELTDKDKRDFEAYIVQTVDYNINQYRSQVGEWIAQIKEENERYQRQVEILQRRNDNLHNQYLTVYEHYKFYRTVYRHLCREYHLQPMRADDYKCGENQNTNTNTNNINTNTNTNINNTNNINTNTNKNNPLDLKKSTIITTIPKPQHERYYYEGVAIDRRAMDSRSAMGELKTTNLEGHTRKNSLHHLRTLSPPHRDHRQPYNTITMSSVSHTGDEDEDEDENENENENENEDEHEHEDEDKDKKEKGDPHNINERAYIETKARSMEKLNLTTFNNIPQSNIDDNDPSYDDEEMKIRKMSLRTAMITSKPRSRRRRRRLGAKGTNAVIVIDNIDRNQEMNGKKICSNNESPWLPNKNPKFNIYHSANEAFIKEHSSPCTPLSDESKVGAEETDDSNHKLKPARTKREYKQSLAKSDNIPYISSSTRFRSMPHRYENINALKPKWNEYESKTEHMETKSNQDHEKREEVIEHVRKKSQESVQMNDHDLQLSLEWDDNQQWLAALELEEQMDKEAEEEEVEDPEERNRIIAFLESLPVRTPRDTINWLSKNPKKENIKPIKKGETPNARSITPNSNDSSNNKNTNRSNSKTQINTSITPQVKTNTTISTTTVSTPIKSTDTANKSYATNDKAYSDAYKRRESGTSVNVTGDQVLQTNHCAYTHNLSTKSIVITPRMLQRVQSRSVDRTGSDISELSENRSKVENCDIDKDNTDTPVTRLDEDRENDSESMTERFKTIKRREGQT